jgi:tyrosine-protein kinase Etk/Wzc
MIKKEDQVEYIIVDNDNDTINIREEAEKYLHYWKWFVLGVFIALIGSYLYLRYTPNLYEVSTSILIDDESSGSLPSELAAFEELGLLGGGKKSVENEIGILQSRTLMERVVKQLDLSILYYAQGKVRASEVHKNVLPFKITFLSKDSLFYKRDTIFKLQFVSKNKFKLTSDNEKYSKSYVLGENVTSNIGDFTITPVLFNNMDIDLEYQIKISPLKFVEESLRENISIEVLSKKSSILVLKLKGPIKLKSQEILNELIRQYNNDAVDYKSVIAKNTRLFINDRLAVIEKELSKVDSSVEQFKTSNKLSDIPTEVSIIIENNSDIEKKIIDLNTQLKLADYVSTYIEENTNQLIPANLGLADDGVNSNSQRYNTILLERNRVFKSTGKKNPIIINLDAQIQQLRESISQGLRNLKTSLQITLNEALVQEQNLLTRITSAPGQEREFRDIQRHQQIIETLYLFLLEKREENAISLAVTVPNTKLVDSADGSDIPVSPDKKLIYGIAIMLGLLVPFVIIYILFLFDNKVHTSKDVEAVVKAPFLGDIPKATTEQKVVVSGTDGGSVSEAFRMLRTNVNFMLTNIKKSSKTIYVTSTIPNEGKTFIAINLATALALSNKRVLLIGSDMRKPKIAEYLGVKLRGKGLSRFLIDSNLNVQDIIEHIQETNFDIIQSGIVPPNPSELLMNGRFEDLLAYGKEHYDYLIVDTSPVNMVTDTLLLSQNADLCLYVIRANYLDKRMLEIPKKLYEEKRLPNMALVLNNSDLTKGYGYGYGYGNSEESSKKGWLKKLRI